jgi:trans-2,3-dihydro-3-hydroxyanthranilate isomerase
MSLDFTIVDVFSDRAFGGNQLAVFPDADGISDATMQRLAREFNFAETTFVLPPDDPAHTCRVRIFTPRAELPFAGHPTVGTAVVLARQGEAGSGAERRLVFEEGIGAVTVITDGQTARLQLDSPDLETAPHGPSTAAVARALSLPDTAVLRCWYAGVGVRFCFAHLADTEEVDRAALDKTAWQAGVPDNWSAHLYLFAGECRDGGRLYARMFAPALGVDEDPATGSAAAAVVASLADDSLPRDGSYHLQIDQGVSMGRPSLIEAAARKEHGRLAEVTVGGHATVVGRGVMTLGAN